MEPPKKQIKLGSSSSNARAAIPTSPHSIDASQEHVESPRRGEDDWALVTFVGEQIQDPRKCKKAMEKVNIEPCVKMDTQTLDLLKIRDDVTWYIRKLGLSKLFKLECSEYSQLTKEFLSTVALAFPNHNGDQPAGDGLLLFKIGDANGRISISALCQLFGLPNETAHDFKENSKRKQAAFADWTHFANEPFLPSRSKVSRITHPAIRYVHRLISTTFQCKQEANKLAQDLEGNKKLCVRFGRLITAIVQHVGIDIPNYEPLPKPTPLDLHALQHIHFLNRWTKDPTRFCYEFPIGPANTSLVLLPHETSQAYAQVLSLSSPMRKTSMFHQVRNHHSPCSPIAHFSMQSRLNAATKNAMFSLLAWPHQALDR
ncbi:unnamed protein product [Microthlaspi erraticum]|uniref:Arabidopsis retrotransposon Orf1 C-terminal domain-containing protein n=1 Tax=Microthlaspi erraticum TaxID=1685480 RepID=A0A6D2I050_9BRAS|nr:unnamed protein product [Microthlaspi erraticum]